MNEDNYSFLSLEAWKRDWGTAREHNRVIGAAIKDAATKGDWRGLKSLSNEEWELDWARQMAKEHPAQLGKILLEAGVAGLAVYAAFAGNNWLRHQRQPAENPNHGLHQVVNPPIRPPLGQILSGSSTRQAPQKQGKDSPSR